MKGGAADRINEKMVGLEHRKKDLEVYLAEAVEPPPLLHPEMANYYRVQVGELYAAMQEDSEQKRATAADIIRSLVKEIVLTPSGDELKIDVRGDLAGILGISVKNKEPRARTRGSQVEMVAGAGFAQNLRPNSQFEMVAGICSNLRSRTDKRSLHGAFDVVDLASQIEMLAGGHLRALFQSAA